MSDDEEMDEEMFEMLEMHEMHEMQAEFNRELGLDDVEIPVTFEVMSFINHIREFTYMTSTVCGGRGVPEKQMK